MSPLALDSYRLLGRSGLRVSPLSLGTMTFGTDWGWGADEQEARRIFHAYLEQGGNFIDTASQYTNGASEQFVGRFANSRRDTLVIATKYTMALRDRDPNSGGNHRKSMMQSVDRSLRQLSTGYIDLLYLHFWDSTTHVDEILRAMDDLVRSGKVLYLGISDTPAWQISRMQTLADLRGWSPLIALQIEYNLIERSGEHELIPMARELGLGVIPWGPLAGGVLTGKYHRRDFESGRTDESWSRSRKGAVLASGALSERGLRIAEVVKEIAAELGKPPPQVALAWVLQNPAVVSPLIGARSMRQFRENIAALAVSLTSDQQLRLNQASESPAGFPHEFLARMVRLGFMSEGLALKRRAL